jgi:two-component system nitrate/nitrite sensor histidine kinase NarQ
MSYQKLKWSILIFPPIASGLWEYVRHDYLHHMIPMALGNWVASIVVFLVLIAITFQLFRNMEKNMAQLQMERMTKAQFEDREQMARSLHDGIAQSLFLLSIKLEQQKVEEAKLILADVDQYVRESIAHLRLPVQVFPNSWDEYLQEKSKWLKEKHDIELNFRLSMKESVITTQEKHELMKIISESLQNIVKHARARQVNLQAEMLSEDSWFVSIEDDGIGFDVTQDKQWTFGIKMMEQLSERMGWHMNIHSSSIKTTIEIRRG